MTPEQLKEHIDTLSQEEMARIWRFSAGDNPLLQGEVGTYFAQSFQKKGGMTPEISKRLGWD